MMVGEGGVVVVFDLLGHFAPLTGAHTWRDLRAIDGSGDDNVYAVGDAGVVLRYNGAAWAKTPFPVTEDLHDVWVAGPTSIYAAGDNGRILHSADGDNWTIQTSGTAASLRGIHGTTDQAIHCVGAAGTVLRRTAGTWQAQTAPAGDYNDVWMESATAGWLVGDAGLLVRVVGTSYSAAASPVASDLNAVWGTAPDHVFAVGAGGAALLYDGTDWRVTPTPNSGDLLAVTGDGSGAAWAIGATGGALLRWGGSAWKVDDGPAAGEMRGLWRASNHLLVAGRAGAILEYRN
jgi:hypothetical protein